MKIIAIDPGLTGGIAILSADGYIVEDMPVIANGSTAKVRNVVNAYELARLLRPHTDVTAVYVEKVSTMPGQGVASQGSLMHSAGVIEGVIGALGMPLVLVTPAKWKKAMGLGSDKEQSRAMAQRLFPQAPLARKKDHNRAEALMLAEYGRRQGGA